MFLQRHSQYTPLIAKDNKKMRKQGIIYIILILAVWSCREDFERNVATPIPFTPELLEDYVPAVDMVRASLVGFVQDDDQNPIADAQVTLNGILTTTDRYGHFFYTDHPMNKEGTTVEIQADKYHKHSELFYPSEDAVEQLDIIMTEIEEESEFNGSTGGSISLNEGILLEYSEEAFLSSDGSKYEGTVSVYSTFMEASEENFALKAPGNFQAVSIENRLVGLQPQSLLKISFRDEAGNDLLINQDADVTVQIPSISPTIEAWYFAPSFGLYTINTNNEVSNTTARIGLSHNNFVLLGQSYASELNTIELSAGDGSGLLEDMLAEWRDEAGTVIQSARSNDMGLVKINFPLSLGGNLVVKDACNNIVYNEASSDIVPEISLDDVSLKTLVGDLYDCNVVPIDDGVIAVAQGDLIRYHYLNNSTFALTLQVCNNGAADVQGLDGISLGMNQATSVNLQATEELGDLFTCDDPLVNMLQLVNLTTGVEYFYPIQSFDINNTDELTIFEFVNNGQEINIQLNFSGNAADDYSLNSLHEIAALEDNTKEFDFAGDADSFLVSKFGSSNKLTLGTFEGTFEDNDRQVFEELQGTFNFYIIE